MKKVSIFSIYLFAILIGCTSTSVISKDLTGQEVIKNYNKLQNFVYSFENEELGGAMTETYVNVYKISNQKCAIVGRTFGDSGFGGSETLIYFKNKKMLSASLRPFSILGRKDDRVKNIQPKSVSYLKPFPSSSVKSILEESFKGYLKKMNKNTLKDC